MLGVDLCPSIFIFFRYSFFLHTLPLLARCFHLSFTFYPYEIDVTHSGTMALMEQIA